MIDEVGIKKEIRQITIALKTIEKKVDKIDRKISKKTY